MGEAAERIGELRRRSVNFPHWYGWLCRDTFDAVADRLTRMLGGKRYTFVTANSYDENSRLFNHYEVRTGQRLARPPRISKDGSHWHISFLDYSYAWSLWTKVQSESDAQNGSHLDQVRLAFNDDRVRGGESLTIDHFAPAGYRLLWTVVTEDHSDG